MTEELTGTVVVPGRRGAACLDTGRARSSCVRVRSGSYFWCAVAEDRQVVPGKPPRRDRGPE
jgi:hypothetical protein